MLNDRAERGRKAKEHDHHWGAMLSNLEAHKQRMSGSHLRVISSRHQQETQKLRTAQSSEAVNSLVERTVLLNALRLQQEADGERATTASEESAEQRRRRYHEHREYLARLRQEAHDREQAALRAIALKDEACRLAQERAQEQTRQKVQRVADDRKVYEGRRKQSLDYHAKRGEQRQREMNSHADREAFQEDRLREHQARKDLDSRARARHLDEQLEAGVQLAHDILENKREDNLGKIQMMSSRSEQHLESYNGRRAAAAFDRHVKYDTTHGRAIQRRNDNHNAREEHIFGTMARKQASMDGLRQRRQQRDFEAAGHTYGQLRTKHALGDAERQLHVKADFAPSETASQLGRAKSVGNLNALRRPSASIALRCHGQLGVGLTGLASLA